MPRAITPLNSRKLSVAFMQLLKTLPLDFTTLNRCYALALTGARVCMRVTFKTRDLETLRGSLSYETTNSTNW